MASKNLKIHSSSKTSDTQIDADFNDSDSDSGSSESVFSVGNITDVEDMASQIETIPKCGTSVGILQPQLVNSLQGDDSLTDVEDFNGTDSEHDDYDDDDRQKNNKNTNCSDSHSDIKLSLHDFFQIAKEQLLIGNSEKEKIVHKSGNFLESQASFGLANDNLTDCEEYDDVSDYDDNYENSAAFDINEVFVEQGRLNIADATHVEGDNNDEGDSDRDCDSIDDDEYDSVATDSNGQSISAISDVLNFNVRENSPEIEIPQMCENDDNCTDIDSDITENSHLEGSLRNLNSYINDNNPIDVAAPNNNNNLQRSNDGDNLSVTDCEDIICDDPITAVTVDALLPSQEHEKETFSDIKTLPAPQRTIISFYEDKQGSTITNLLPLSNDYQLGLSTLNPDGCITDTEDYSLADDQDSNFNYKDDNTINVRDIMEDEIVTENEFMKPGKSNRFNSPTNLDSVTDTEDLNIAIPNRRRKKTVKPREINKENKEKSHCLEVNAITYQEDGITDLEDLDISDCDQNVNNNERVSRKEQYFDVALPKDAKDSKASNYTRTTDHDVIISESLIDKRCLQAKAEMNNPVCKEMNEMLNESYTMVHEKCSNSFDIDAEKLHIKTVNFEASTDTEYIESDDSVMVKAANDH